MRTCAQLSILTVQHGKSLQILRTCRRMAVTRYVLVVRGC
jgi:hypothetical protein